MLFIPISFLIFTTTLCLAAPLDSAVNYNKDETINELILRLLGGCDAKEVPLETRKVFGMDPEDPYRVADLKAYREFEIVQDFYSRNVSSEGIDENTQLKDLNAILLKNSGLDVNVYPLKEFVNGVTALELKKNYALIAFMDAVCTQIINDLEPFVTGKVHELGPQHHSLATMRALHKDAIQLRPKLANFWETVGYKTQKDMNDIYKLIESLRSHTVDIKNLVNDFNVGLLVHWTPACQKEMNESP